MAKETVVEEREKEINLDEKVTVVNVAPWLVGFARIETIGDVSIPPRGSIRLSRSEIIAQSRNGNNLINGIGMGSHATIYIDDKYTREELDFENGTQKQNVISKEVVSKIFDSKTIKTFKEAVDKHIVTRAERFALVDYIKELKINDYEKLRYLEEYLNIRL